jgi:hypothetical protein
MKYGIPWYLMRSTQKKKVYSAHGSGGEVQKQGVYSTYGRKMSWDPMTTETAPRFTSIFRFDACDTTNFPTTPTPAAESIKILNGSINSAISQYVRTSSLFVKTFQKRSKAKQTKHVSI